MRRRIPLRLSGVVLLLLSAAFAPPGLAAQSASGDSATLTLQGALAEARRANAELPVASLDVQAAMARAEQARGQLYPFASVDGDVHTGAPVGYASSDALLRLLGQWSVYQGGELRAGRDRSQAEADALRAGYRVAVREVDYRVRTSYARVLHAQDVLSFLQRGIERLQSYLTVIQSRQAGGQGVGADLLRTRQRIAAAEAEVASFQREQSEAEMELNDALGRAPTAELRLEPLPDPGSPPDTTGNPWLQTPDLVQAQSQVRAAQAGIRAAEAARKPHVYLEADAGTQPVLNSDVALLNNGRGWGTEATLSFSLPFWDKGVYQGRLAEAQDGLEQAQQQEVVQRRAARLEWTRAAVDLNHLFLEFQAQDRATSAARDAYLQAESLYRGGQGNAVDVLDAYDAWVQTGHARLDVIFGYRATEANLYRWGNP